MIYCADSWFILMVFEKKEKSMQLLREARTGKTKIIIPLIVFAEATKKLLQRGIRETDIDFLWATLEAIENVKPMVMDKPIAREAAKISLSFKLPLIDAMIAATCKITGCHALLTGDQDYHLLVKQKYLDVVGW